MWGGVVWGCGFPEEGGGGGGVVGTSALYERSRRGTCMLFVLLQYLRQQ